MPGRNPRASLYHGHSWVPAVAAGSCVVDGAGGVWSGHSPGLCGWGQSVLPHAAGAPDLPLLLSAQDRGPTAQGGTANPQECSTQEG